MFYLCPVCGFERLPHVPANYNICPCCGTEFGLDDTTRSYEDLRNDWIMRGTPWFSRHLLPRIGWNPFLQMTLADLEYHPGNNESQESNQQEEIDLGMDARFERNELSFAASVD